MKHFTSPAVTVYYGESLDFESLSTLSHCGNAIILFLYENTLSNRYCPDPVYYALFFSLIGASTVLVSKVHNSESAALKQLIEASTFDWRNGVSQLVNADTTGTNQCELYGLDLKFST
jgi:hypothetical protein